MKVKVYQVVYITFTWAEYETFQGTDINDVLNRAYEKYRNLFIHYEVEHGNKGIEEMVSFHDFRQALGGCGNFYFGAAYDGYYNFYLNNFEMEV